jgi:hypothetical protein
MDQPIVQLPEWETRLREEREELNKRMTKLFDFLPTAAFQDLHGVDQGLLREQYRLMISLYKILDARCHRAEMLRK